MEILLGSIATVIGAGSQWLFSTIAGSLQERKRINKIASRVLFYIYQIWFPMYRIRHFDTYWTTVWERLSKDNEEAASRVKEKAYISAFEMLMSFTNIHFALDDKALDRLNSSVQDLAEDFPFDALEITNTLKLLNYRKHFLEKFYAAFAEAHDPSNPEGEALALSLMNSTTAVITDEQLSDLESRMQNLSRHTSRTTRKICKQRIESGKEIDIDTVDRMVVQMKEIFFSPFNSNHHNPPEGIKDR